MSKIGKRKYRGSGGRQVGSFIGGLQSSSHPEKQRSFTKALEISDAETLSLVLVYTGTATRLNGAVYWVLDHFQCRQNYAAQVEAFSLLGPKGDMPCRATSRFASIAQKKSLDLRLF